MMMDGCVCVGGGGVWWLLGSAGGGQVEGARASLFHPKKLAGSFPAALLKRRLRVTANFVYAMQSG